MFFIKTRLVFKGDVAVMAESREQAECLAQTQLSALLGKVQTSDDAVVDWAYPMHADVELVGEEATGDDQE